MTLFDDSPRRIFKDTRWLQPLSNPPEDKPLCRKADMKQIAGFISQVFSAGQSRNIFICGRPGTGKTVCIRHLLDEVNKHAQDTGISVTGVYVNAGRTRTPYYTMLEIVECLGLKVPDAGWQMFRLKRAFENILRKKAVVIAVDEVDAILLKEREPIIYYLNRQTKVTLILISNKMEDASKLPERALSTLQPQLVILKPYTLEQIETILKKRIEYAFQPQVISDKLLNIVAKKASEKGDIRLAFSILLSAGLSAEKANRSKITIGDIESAVKNEAVIGTIKEIGALTKKLAEFDKRK